MNIEEIEREHEKSLMALEQEIEGWKSANRILNAKLEQAEKSLEEVYECGSIKQAEIISGAALQVIRGK